MLNCTVYVLKSLHTWLVKQWVVEAPELVCSFSLPYKAPPACWPVKFWQMVLHEVSLYCTGVAKQHIGCLQSKAPWPLIAKCQHHVNLTGRGSSHENLLAHHLPVQSAICLKQGLDSYLMDLFVVGFRQCLWMIRHIFPLRILHQTWGSQLEFCVWVPCLYFVIQLGYGKWWRGISFDVTDAMMWKDNYITL